MKTTINHIIQMDIIHTLHTISQKNNKSYSLHKGKILFSPNIPYKALQALDLPTIQ